MKLCATAVVQNIVTTLADYGVPEDSILGIRYGLRGFYDRSTKPICLSQALVDDIHLKGGTILVHPHGPCMSVLLQICMPSKCHCKLSYKSAWLEPGLVTTTAQL